MLAAPGGVHWHAFASISIAANRMPPPDGVIAVLFSSHEALNVQSVATYNPNEPIMVISNALVLNAAL